MSEIVGKQRKKVEPPKELSLFEESNLLYGGWGHFLEWSEEEARAAWMAHRDELLKEFVGRGRRPNAFWRFDFPGVLEEYANAEDNTFGIDELKALAMIGQATPEELMMLEEGIDPYEEEEVEAWRKSKGLA